MISKSSRNTIVECIIIGLIDILFSTYNMLLVHEWCDSSFPQASGPTFVTSMWETINPKTPFFFFAKPWNLIMVHLVLYPNKKSTQNEPHIVKPKHLTNIEIPFSVHNNNSIYSNRKV